MIKAVLVFNIKGQARLLRFYSETPIETQMAITRHLHGMLVDREEGACFIDAPSEYFEKGHKIAFRQYATLIFCFVIDEAESELGTLDLCQVFVRILSLIFKNVCELDLMFYYDVAYFVLDEMIMAGTPLETSLDALSKIVMEEEFMLSD